MLMRTLRPVKVAHSNFSRRVGDSWRCRGQDGKLVSEELEKFLAGVDFKRAATIPPRSITITQATERGTLYAIDEIRSLTSVAKRYGIRVHMDGARLANALASLECRPADVTWRAGIDLLSFGATKNGTMMADAIVIFDKTLGRDLAQRRRRSGQSTSKMRFMSAQLHAYVSEDLWLGNARKANRAAQRVMEGLSALPGIEVTDPVQVNMIFLRIAPQAIKRSAKAGIQFRPQQSADSGSFRLVTSFLTSDTMRTILSAAAAPRCRHRPAIR